MKTGIFNEIKKEMNKINENEFSLKKREYKNKKKGFFDNIRLLKKKYSKPKNTKISLFMRKISKFILGNNNYYEELVMLDDDKTFITSLIIGASPLFLFIFYVSFLNYQKSSLLINNILPMIMMAGSFIILNFFLLIIFNIFNKRASLYLNLKKLKNEFEKNKSKFVNDECKYLSNKLCIGKLNDDIVNMKNCSLLDNIVNENIMIFLRENLTKEKRKMLSMFCNDEGNITYREVVKFANYIEKADNFQRKVFMEEKEEKYVV